ncbi:unnamed protein product [Orchesella dallaii]|uniref:Uncharacterized protein n=1 Tax=Orchesella dallaii TaxID=48710 RepID=A0ABP1Q116_9HEXA
MFTQHLKNSIAFRFYLNKLSFCSMFHWDYKQDKLVLSSGTIYYIWLAYIATWDLLFLPAFFLTTYYDFYQIGETIDIIGMDEEKQVAIVFYVLDMGLAGYLTLFFGSMLQQDRLECKNFINACFDLDEELSDESNNLHGSRSK